MINTRQLYHLSLSFCGFSDIAQAKIKVHGSSAMHLVKINLNQWPTVTCRRSYLRLSARCSLTMS